MNTINQSTRWQLVVLFCLAITGITIAQKDGEKESRNYMWDMAGAATSLSRFEPKPVWETMVKADQADLLELVGDHHLLVGTIQLTVNVGRPDYSDLYLFDRHTGREIWRSRRKPLRNGSYSVIADTPLIILQGKGIKAGHYTAYNPANGQVVWEHKIDGGYNVRKSPANSALWIWGVRSSKTVIRKLNLADGRILWEHAYPTALKHAADSQSLLVEGRYVYTAHDRVAKLDVESGSLLWSSPQLADDRPLAIAKTGQGILAWNSAAIHLLKESDGRPAWSADQLQYKVVTMDAPLNFPNTAVATCQKSLGEAFGKELFRKVLLGVDLGNGRIRWQYDPRVPILSSLLVFKNNMYFTCSDALRSLDINKGEVNFQVELPLAAGSKLLPDILIPARDLLLIVREHAGLAAFSPGKRRMAWHQQYIENMYHSWFWYATAAAVLKKYEAGSQSAEDDRRKEADWWRNWTGTVNIQWSVDGDLSGHGKMGHFGAHMYTFQTALAFSSILKAQIIKDVLEGIVSRLRLWVANSVRLHLRSVQGNYYVRPFYKQGEGVLVVDLATGKRCDLEYSPPNKGMQLFTMRLPQFTLDPGANRLYTLGISLDKSKHQKYVKIKVGMPYPSLQAFDLAALTFTKNATNDMMLTVAAKKGDNEGILQYLKAGVSINSRNGDGRTALYRAALKGHLHTVQLLIARGADLDAGDENGETALWAACEKGYPEIARALIAAGADVNVRNKYENTMLWTMKKFKKKAEIIQLLTAAGAE